MRILPFFLLLLSISINPISCSTPNPILSQGSSISVEKPDNNLQSADGLFSAGFHRIGENAYAFSVWFTSPSCPDKCAVVWMANRDFPVNGRRSGILLTKTGNLVLTDASSKSVAWSTNTNSESITELRLEDSGNLVLKNLGEEGTILWQSFDYPTDTLLPSQKLTRQTQLVSPRSSTNVSSGFYKLLFTDNNILSLVYDGPDVSSIYWPDPLKLSWDNGRQTYNNSRTASLDSLGNFTSSDHLSIASIDYGRALHRRMTLDYDGNLRIYSRDEASREWSISGQAMWDLCTVHGVCGANSTCFYSPETALRCTCIPGYKMRNPTDWSFGCEPEFSLHCPHQDEADFLRIPHQGFYGYEGFYGFKYNTTFFDCKNTCLNSCSCKGFVYKFEDGVFKCFTKILLLNGHHSPTFNGDFYEKTAKGSISIPSNKTYYGWQCPERDVLNAPLDRTYSKSRGSNTVKLLLIVAITLMGIEVTCILVVCLYSAIMSRKSSSFRSQQGYPQLLRFQRFAYSELAKATRNFGEEVGRGAAGIVYRGRLADGRVAAIKKLYGANHGEAEFLAEITTIGQLNHMNLIEMWGYCAEGQQRILVYEYMEHGSLAQNLSSKSLTWERRFNIALGTARGLAYLHEECLEWVLHCDVKPQNILLDADYQPKVSDFGLSKLLNRNDSDNLTFSKIRGTRGYMAPQWVFNLPITSKVDVYSYGVVVLELVTGKVHDGGAEAEHERVVTWARNRINELGDGSSWIEEMMDPTVEGEYDRTKMEVLVSLALQCVVEDIYERPTMGKVVETLLLH